MAPPASVLLLLAPLASALPTPNNFCNDYSFTYTIVKGEWMEHCCHYMQPGNHISYAVEFTPRHADEVILLKFVADDSGSTGHCAGSKYGPKDWKTFDPRSYTGHDNTYVEKKSITTSGAKFKLLQMGIRFTCHSPGEGNACLVTVDRMKVCEGDGCQFNSLDNRTAIAGLTSGSDAA